MEEKVKKILDNTKKGLSFGLKNLNIATGGIQREAIYTIGAAPKVGKTMFVDYAFLLSPYLNDYLKGRKIKWIYFSFEISRVRKMFRLAPFFFKTDFNKETFFHKGKEYKINYMYLIGKMLDDDEELIKVKEEDKKIFEEIYKNRLFPLFGGMINGKFIEGAVTVIEMAENPTGLRNYILNYAKENGNFITMPYTTLDNYGKKIIKQKIVDYKPNDEELYTIIIVDHIRKLKSEKNYNIKQIIDKWYQYQVELRNWCGFTFVNVAHLNRGIDSIDRMRFNKDKIYPGLSDFKDSGNSGEESDYVITGFNPNEDKFMLKTHFGHYLTSFPGYRSWHLIASRDTKPAHFFTQINGNNNIIKQIN